MTDLTDNEFMRMQRNAEKTPSSGFANFNATLQGYRIFERSTGKAVAKFELWEIARNQPEMLAKLTSRRHNDYVFINVKDLEGVK